MFLVCRRKCRHELVATLWHMGLLNKKQGTPCSWCQTLKFEVGCVTSSWPEDESVPSTPPLMYFFHTETLVVWTVTSQSEVKRWSQPVDGLPLYMWLFTCSQAKIFSETVSRVVHLCAPYWPTGIVVLTGMSQKRWGLYIWISSFMKYTL